MLERYVDFDQIVKQMIAQHEDNMTALQSLTEQYAELLALETEDGPLKSSAAGKAKAKGKGEWVINQSIQRQIVKKKIDDLEEERRLFDKAWSLLTSEDRVVLEQFFMKGLKSGDAVDFLCRQFCYERPTAYRRKEEALKRFKGLLFG